MYDDLVKRLRDAAKMSEALAVLLPHSEGNATAKLYNEAAEGIEELMRENESLAKTVNEADELLHKRGTPPKWVPVTERLPEFEGAVLCMRKSNVYGVRAYQEILYVDEYGFKNFDDIYLADGVVTHWMPLPQPPGSEIMSKSFGNGLLTFGLCFFISSVLKALGYTVLETFIYSLIPSIAINIGIWILRRKEEGE